MEGQAAEALAEIHEAGILSEADCPLEKHEFLGLWRLLMLLNCSSDTGRCHDSHESAATTK
jgi:hypothetical protein